MPIILNENEVQEILDLIRLAGEEIIKIYFRQQADWKVSLKEDRTPLTEADRLSNSVINEGLKKLFPEIPIISEENREIPYDIRRKYEYYWLLDPLDGTKEFLKQNGEFTVNLALIQQGKPVAGFISVPVKGWFYFAVKGRGAYKIEIGEKQDGSQGERQIQQVKQDNKLQLRAAQFSIDDPGLTVLASRSHFDSETRKFIESLNQPRLESRGSSLKFMMLAEGLGHLYPRLGRTMEWDTAAGQAILEEAGGQVVEFSSRQPLRYNKESLVNPPFLATGALRNKG
ncbi:MAG TPA: 3'(2'),5'-bisphosphate nucleotidase CysQ [Candidatus Saccharicenans sp.]|jgi:3'(2'), 5'-bisphosphate nucleotidase|nr:3'(2'),5'-bisphosphate nucleotidase CysQ [Candidatus Saccharicenans sp.]